MSKSQELKSLRIDRGPAGAANGTTPSFGGGSGDGLVFGLGLPSLLGIGAVVLALGLIWYFSGSGQQASSANATIPRTSGANGASPQVAQANPAPATISMPPSGLVASGYVVARRVATVSAEITGRVTEVLVEEGIRVEAGQVLARLDSSLVDQDLPLSRAQVASTQADLAGIAVSLAEAERILGRTRPLAERNAASQADLTANEAKVAGLRAQRDKARALLEIAELSVRRTQEQVARYEIHAPFSGVVTEKSAQRGEIVSPLSTGGFTRTGICTIVDMDSLEFEVDVNESNIGRVSPNQPVEAVLDAYPDLKIPAAVIAVIPTANRDKAAIKVRIKILTKDARILPNMAAKVTFVEKAASPAKAG